MTTLVNPPPRPRIPKAFLQDAEVRGYIEQLQTIIFQLYQRTGGEEDEVTALLDINVSTFNSTLQQLQKEIDGLPEFTIDTTVFTTDTTLITTDKVTA